MRRADRLLRLIQVLRRQRRPVTAETIADELEVSVRTVYRDIAALQAERVPIRGEAGIGYVLDDGFDLPPLMFSPDEIEALILGLRWVARYGDSELARASRDVVAKIGTVLPPQLKPVLYEATFVVPPAIDAPTDCIDVSQLRAAVRRGCKVEVDYRDEAGCDTRRTIWPFAFTYYKASRVVVCWCELRGGFRHLRTDRIAAMRVLDKHYPERRAVLARRWQDEMRREMNRPALELFE
ncbi:MAG: helix-turn-helix transcriptional regulator [Pseudorhodoplanes sp.]